MMSIEQTVAGIQNLAKFCEGLAEQAARTVLRSEDHPEGIEASGKSKAYRHLAKVLWDFAEEVLDGDGEGILEGVSADGKPVHEGDELWPRLVVREREPERVRVERFAFLPGGTRDTERAIVGGYMFPVPLRNLYVERPTARDADGNEVLVGDSVEFDGERYEVEYIRFNEADVSGLDLLGFEGGVFAPSDRCRLC